MIDELGSARPRRRRPRRTDADDLLASILEATREGVLIVDVDGSLVSVNDRFAELWGLPEGAVAPTCEEIGHHIDDQLTEGKGFLLDLTSWADTSKDSETHRLDLKDGRSIEARSEPLVLHGETSAHVWRFRDITEETQSRDRMDQFVKVASHDLREPLRSLSGHLELLETQLNQLDAPAEESLDHALDSADEMRRMIDELVAYARAGAGSQSLERVALGEVLEDAVERVETKVQETDTQVDVHELPAVQGNRTQLTRVFQNLLDNAIKYNDKPTPWVQVDAHVQGGNVRVSIEDNGPGIPEDERDAIFEMFHRGTNGQHAPGTGIGLALCREIIERHGGDFGVEESTTGGARFEFTLTGS